MGRKKTDPVPLASILARRAGKIPARGHIVPRILPLPGPITMYFWFPRQPVPKSGTFWVETKKGNRSPVADKRQVATEKATRELILDQIEDYYPEYIPYLPLINGSVAVSAIHLMKQSRDWYPGWPHIKTPDVDNLGKLIKDAGAARTQGVLATLYYDDCPVDDDWQRKVYWDDTVTDPNYPQQPGTLLAITMTPLPDPPDGKFRCPFCARDYKKQADRDDHILDCPLYNMYPDSVS